MTARPSSALVAAFSAMVEHTGECVEVTDLGGRWCYVNPAFEATMGFRREEVLGRTPAEMIRSGAHPPEYYKQIWETISRGDVWTGELISRHKSGALIVMHSTVLPVRGEDGRIANYIAIKRDVTDHEHASEEYQALTGAAGDAIITCDFESAYILSANPAACRLFGYSVDEFRQLKGRMLSPASAMRDVDVLAEEFVRRGQARRRVAQLTKDGREFWADVRLSGFEVAGQRQYVAILRDVTEAVEREAELARSYAELKDAKARLAHSDKLAALGQVAAGVAHEINNPAGFVSVNLSMIGERLASAADDATIAECRQMLSECIEGLERIRSIATDLRTFARIERDQVGPVDLNDAVRVACRLVGNEIRHRAQLVQRLGTIPIVPGEQAKLVSVLTNLLVNAAQSITSGNADANRVEITTVADDGGVRILIRDTGCGVPEELRSRVFEPFVTTKPAGTGTGLGLSLCADIVHKHGGRIDLDGDAGPGTRVDVWLPASEIPVRAQRSVSAPPVQQPAARCRVLLVDDDPLILSAFSRALQEIGEVVTAGSGREALGLLARDADFDTVLCDLMMPTMDGPALYEAVAEIAPELLPRFVFCSGGAFTPRAREFVATLENRLIEKPITASELRDAIRSASAPWERPEKQRREGHGS